MPPAPLMVAFFSGWAQIFLYGCNVVLFGAGTFLLAQRKGLNKNFATFFIPATILLAQATVSAVVATVVIIGQISRNSNINLNACEVIIFVIVESLDLSACFILVHRCYALYNRSWKVIVFPMLIILTDIGAYSAELSFYVRHPIIDTGVLLVKDKTLAQLSMTIVVLKVLASSSLTLLIAGRIWSIRRRMRSLIGKGTSTIYQKYNNLIAMTLESGFMIPVSFIAMEVFVHMNDGVGSSVLGACIPQIMALAPLLIMVRFGLGLTVEPSHITIQVETTGHETGVESQTPRPLTVSVTTLQTVNVSGGNDESSQSDLGRNDTKQFGYAV